MHTHFKDVKNSFDFVIQHVRDQPHVISLFQTKSEAKTVINFYNIL